jgi:hypothetical protein
VRCPDCQQEGPLELRGSAEVTIGTVAVALEARPVVACPQRHEATPREVVGAAMQAVERQVPQARARLLRGDVCRDCRTPLTMPVRRTERPVTVESEGERPVLTLLFDLPSSRCPDCGADQLPSRSQEDLVVAVPALFARPSS